MGVRYKPASVVEKGAALPLARDDFTAALAATGLTLSEVAKESGIHRNYLSEFRAGTRNLQADALKRLRDYFESNGVKFTEDEGVELNDADAFSPAKIEAVASKRFVFPVADEVSDDTLAATLATISDNDKRLNAMLSQVAERSDSLFGAGEYTETTLQAFRESFSLLAANYLLIRTIGGWPEVGLAAANVSMATDTVLAGVIADAREVFERAGLIGESEQEEEVEA